MEICSRFTGMERKDGAFLLHTDNADVKVCFVTDEIVRVRASFDHELAEESYILMTTAWEDRMDDLFKGERTRVEPLRLRSPRTTRPSLCHRQGESGGRERPHQFQAAVR